MVTVKLYLFYESARDALITNMRFVEGQLIVFHTSLTQSNPLWPAGNATWSAVLQVCGLRWRLLKWL
jgi:hypothetical protein